MNRLFSRKKTHQNCANRLFSEMAQCASSNKQKTFANIPEYIRYNLTRTIVIHKAHFKVKNRRNSSSD